MSRPTKIRRVCGAPYSDKFGPEKPVGTVVMTVDEYETIRLIDYEGFSQEACADHMNVARTTVQAMYTAARKKIAACLVAGESLEIAGGAYKIGECRLPCCMAAQYPKVKIS